MLPTRRTLLHGTVLSTEKDSMEVNLGARLFGNMNNTVRQAGASQAEASQYKE